MDSAFAHINSPANAPSPVRQVGDDDRHRIQGIAAPGVCDLAPQRLDQPLPGCNPALTSLA